LCARCNLRLGLVEKANWLFKAVAYLERPVASGWKPSTPASQYNTEDGGS
jgi:hypothetical protein